MICPSCGKKNTIIGAVYCEYCGGKLSKKQLRAVTAKQPRNVKKQSDTKKIPKIYTVIFLIIISILCLFVILILAIGVWHIVRNIDNGIEEGSTIRYYNAWKYTDGADGPYEIERLGEAYARNVTISINDIVDYEDGTAEANVTVVCPDISVLLYDRMEEALNSNKSLGYNEIFEEIENDLIWDFYFSTTTEEFDVTLKLIERNGEWYIADSSSIDEIFSTSMKNALYDVVGLILMEGQS